MGMFLSYLVVLSLAKNSGGIGRKLDQRHALIPSIKVLILAEKCIALAQSL